MDRNNDEFGTSYIKNVRRNGGCHLSNWSEFYDALEETTGQKDIIETSIQESSIFFSNIGTWKAHRRKDMKLQGYDVYFVYTYIPYSGRNENTMSPISEKLMDRKKPCLKIIEREGHKEIVDFFTEDIANWLSKESELTITVAPSKSEGLNGYNPSGEREIAKNLCKKFSNFVNGTECLRRTKSLKEKDKPFSLQEHEESISILSSKKINKKNVIVLDNITTTGSTLMACIDKIKKAGASKVIGLAIAITRGKDGQ